MKHLCTLALLMTAFNMQAQLKVNAGTQMVNNGTIVITNTGLLNNGSFLNSNGANVVFSGAGNHAIAGSGVTSFYGLELNKISDSILLQSNITVAGPLKLTKGSLNLMSNSVQLMYPNGLLQNETEQNRIYATGNGIIFIEQLLNAPSQSNPGNLGFIITSANNLGTTVISRGHDKQSKAGGAQSIKRYYSIVPATNTGINASFTFSYLDIEFDGQSDNGRKLFQKSGSANWQEVNISSSNTQNNTINVTGVNSLDKFTVFPASASLPLQLLAFTARCREQGAILQWITANEVQTKQFVIETSNDGYSWQPANIVLAQGNTTQQTYTATVTTAATFFRLKMEDADGKFVYSPVRKLNCAISTQIVAGPNPTQGAVTISVTAANAKQVTIEVADIGGRILQSKVWQVNAGLNSSVIDLAKYPSSTYLVVVKDGETKELFKIVKQ